MINFGEGSDWNFETDGMPGCICDEIGVELHTPEELWEIHAEQKVTEEQKAPATGEFPVVGICGTLTLFLVGILMFARKIIQERF